MKRKPSILITTGDPAGIGLEVTQKALKDRYIKHIANFFVIEPGDKTGFGALKKAIGILGKSEADGLVTGPVNKSKIFKSGIHFRGHTEYLAAATHTKKYAMMFCKSSFRVTIVTRHVSLREVPRLLTREKIEDATLLTAAALRKYFKIPRPVIGVCALNPHCGEKGLMGTEEKQVVIPAIKRLKRKIPGILGPLPADVIFYMAYKGKIDAVVSMYHDQGLGPFKMLAFEDGVNLTLGLPFIRTSPDHGTAYDIAGKGVANPRSMKEAIRLAVRLCKENR